MDAIVDERAERFEPAFVALGDDGILDVGHALDDVCEVEAGEEIVVIESVKAASDIVAPVAGTITAVNEALADAPGDVNSDAMSAWFFRIKPADGVSLDGFMDETAYQELIG